MRMSSATSQQKELAQTSTRVRDPECQQPEAGMKRGSARRGGGAPREFASRRHGLSCVGVFVVVGLAAVRCTRVPYEGR